MNFANTENFSLQFSNYVFKYNEQLINSFVWFSVSLILLAAVLSVFVYCFYGQRKRFLGKETTPLRFHKMIIPIMILFVFFQLQHLSSPVTINLFVISIIILFVSISGILRFRMYGVFTSVIYIWLTLPIKEIPSLFLSQNDFAQFGVLSVPEQAGLLAEAQYFIFRTIVLEIIALVLTIFVFGYYSHRRYLFDHYIKTHFNGLSRCRGCGILLVFDGDYCPCCGEDIHNEPRSVMSKTPLIIDKYCRKCGSILHRGFCSSCSTYEEHINNLKKTINNFFISDIKSTIIGFFSALLLLVIVLFPMVISNIPKSLTKGSAEDSNIYVGYLRELKSNKALTYNKDWLNDFDNASDTLYNTNKRVFYLDTSRLSYSDLNLYNNYSGAAYQQMIVIERIKSDVYNKKYDEYTMLLNRFDYTNSVMTDAFSNTMFLTLNSRNNYILSVENTFLDSIKFYVSFIDIKAVSVGMLALSIIISIIMLVLVLKIKKEPLFLCVEYETGKTCDLSAYKHKRRKEILLGFCVGLVTAVVIISLVSIEAVTVQRGRVNFSMAFTDLYINKSVELEVWIGDNDNRINLNEKQCETAAEIINAMYVDINVLLHSDENAIDDTELMSGIIDNTNELDKLLNKFMRSVNSYRFPDNLTQKNILKLMKNGMTLNQKYLIENTFNSFANY